MSFACRTLIVKTASGTTGHDGEKAELYGDYITHWMPVPRKP